MITPYISVLGDLVCNLYYNIEKCEKLFFEPRFSLPVTRSFEEKTYERVNFL